MYDFFLQIAFFSSLGVMVFLFARAVPRVSDTGELPHPPGAFDRLLRSLPLSEIDERLNTFFEKLLRKMKVLVMKVDNQINRGINKVKKPNGKGSGLKEEADLFNNLSSSDSEKKEG